MTDDQESKWNFWLTANVSTKQGTTGNIIVECSQCDFQREIMAEWSRSVFWDMHVGREFLVVLGHFDTEHNNGEDNHGHGPSNTSHDG